MTDRRRETCHSCGTRHAGCCGSSAGAARARLWGECLVSPYCILQREQRETLPIFEPTHGR